MMITAFQAARIIDVSAVRAHHTLKDIEEAVSYAKEYHFINVHALPCWIKELSAMLSGVEDVYAGSPVGFPSGGHATSVKVAEAKRLIEDGVQEMDIVINVGKFRNEEYGYVLDELSELVGIAGKNVKTKVIIEINTLTDAEMLKACDLVIQSGADFVKTGTGWVPGGANIERIRRMKEFCGSRIKIKAAGGIRTPSEFMELYNMGVERMGINTKSAIDIVDYFSNHSQ